MYNPQNQDINEVKGEKMISVSPTYKHWNYYMALENDLERLARYIEFNEDNFSTYSIELAHLLLASASEVDVVMKELCALKSSSSRADRINQYQPIIQEHLPTFFDEEIYIHRYGVSVKPWSNWNDERAPNWWRSYNKVKHERDAHFNLANLQHTINAVGALLIVNYHYYKALFELETGSEMRPKLVTNKLQNNFPFVELSAEYYYDNIVC